MKFGYAIWSFQNICNETGDQLVGPPVHRTKSLLCQNLSYCVIRYLYYIVGKVSLSAQHTICWCWAQTHHEGHRLSRFWTGIPSGPDVITWSKIN